MYNNNLHYYSLWQIVACIACHWFGLLSVELLPGVSAGGRGGGHRERWAASSAGLWISSVFFCNVFLLAGQTDALQHAPSASPLLYFYFYQWMTIWSKVILIFSLKRLQLNIHPSWRGLLCSVFGMCITETKGCAFIFKEICRHYMELNNLFHRSAELVKHLPLNCDFFFLSPWILKQNKNTHSLCNSKFNWDASPRFFCSARHIQHEFICSYRQECELHSLFILEFWEIIFINSKSSKTPEFPLIKIPPNFQWTYFLSFYIVSLESVYFWVTLVKKTNEVSVMSCVLMWVINK